MTTSLPGAERRALSDSGVVHGHGVGQGCWITATGQQTLRSQRRRREPPKRRLSAVSLQQP